MTDLSILMPAYNEAATVESAIERLLAVELPVEKTELIVVEDGSRDGTREILAARPDTAGVRVLFHDRNRGKGAALRTGLSAARGAYTTVLDADLEYDPQDLPRLLDPLLTGRAEVVFGSRAFESHSAYGFWYVMGNRAVTTAANLLYNSWLSDIMTCWKLMSTELFRSLRLREHGFGIEPEIAARVLRTGIRVYEVPITYSARSREEGKKLTAQDGLRVLATLLRCRLD